MPELNNSPNSNQSSKCVHPSIVERSAISLPVLRDHNPAGTIRKSKNGKRRAVVLIAIQLLLIAHIVLWLLSKKYGWFGGQTITPIEPSESMEFVKHGVINAGLILFSSALLSTLILGRWFCGWGCHIVMLQDFCGWIMKKMGVRPKPFRSRFLIYVPLLLALYMFVWPAAYRWGLVPLSEKLSANWSSIPNLGPAPAWKTSTHLTTTEFWKTFPGIVVAIPFLLVCGFATVYFLGAKGFCTYGCPYGGFFAPLDKFAVGKILVTDACEGCGHCTAVCTSNVRVHEEVREYGMVVDPGCMKCLDCVSVCPNEALYFGFSKPSVLKGSAKNKPPKRVYDMTLREEFIAAVVFLVTFLSLRGVYEMVPMLMAGGLAGIITFLVWKACRLFRDANVTFYKWQFKSKGAMRPAGWVYGIMVIMLVLLTLHSGVVNAAFALANWHDERVKVAAHAPFIPNNNYLSPTMEAHAKRGIGLYKFASAIPNGGIGLLNTWQSKIDLKISRLLIVTQDFAGAEQLMRRAIDRAGPTDALVTELMWAMYGQHRIQEALDFADVSLLQTEDMSAALDTYVQFSGIANDTERIINLCRERLKRYPDHLKTIRWLSLVLVQVGMLDEGVALIRKTIEIDPNNPAAHRVLAMALADMGNMNEAIDEMKKALTMAPRDFQINSLLADLLESVGRTDDARSYRDMAAQLQAENAAKEHRH